MTRSAGQQPGTLQQPGHVMSLISHNTPPLRRQQGGALLAISRAGFTLSTTPRCGRGRQINLSQTGCGWSLRRAYLPCSLCQNSWGNEWRLKHLDVPQNLSLQSTLQEATCISVKPSGPYWFPPVGDKRKIRVEIIPSTNPGCLGILAGSKCLSSQSGCFLNWSHL